MSLLENQNFRKKISFVKTDDHNKSVQIVFSVSCNHDIDKTILSDIEKNVNDFFLKDYEDLAQIEKQNAIDKEIQKKDAEIQKQMKKQYDTKMKELKKQQLEQKK